MSQALYEVLAVRALCWHSSIANLLAALKPAGRFKLELAEDLVQAPFEKDMHTILYLLCAV